jgi:hypothetical protein
MDLFGDSILRRGFGHVVHQFCTRVIHFYVWDTLKGEVNSTNPGNEGNMTETIQDTQSSISPVAFRRAMNAFVRSNAYLRAKGNHLRHLLLLGN